MILRWICSPAVIGLYLCGFSGVIHLGNVSMITSGSGSLKKAIERRPFFIAAGRGTTRCGVDLKKSLLQREIKSPVLMTTVPGIGGASIHFPSKPCICKPPSAS